MAARVLGRIIAALEIASGIVLMAMMLLTFVDVIGRYILGAPVFGASEMISALLAYLIFLGLGLANARDRHIVVELFDAPIRRLAPRLYEVIIHGFSVLAMCLIVYVLAEQAIESARLGTKTVVLEWPLFWITGPVAVLATLSIVSQILAIAIGAYRRAEPHLEDVG